MLKDVMIRQAKPTKAKPYKLSDSGGLHLLISPNGSKLWRQSYRFSGKQLTLAHGAYPSVTLAQARQAMADAKAMLAKGQDPGLARKLTKLATGNTFKAIAEEVLAKAAKEGRASETLQRNRWVLEQLAYPAFGDRPITDITTPEVLAACRKAEGRGHYEMAKRLRALASSVFRFAVSTARAERNPAADLAGALIAPRPKHRAAIVDPRGIGGLMRAIDSYPTATTRFALRLLALTFVRPGELRFAEWPEFDLDAAVWVIPASRTKMRREHRVPLSHQTLGVLRKLHAITGGGKYLLPSYYSAGRAMSENTLNVALRRLGYGQDAMCSHGFRGMASTQLNEMRFQSDVIERCLGHVERNSVRRAYNHAELWPERISLMQSWADELDRLRDLA
jgi:integrase